MYKFALFDLDGTLTDPAEGILKSVRYALEREGLDTLADQDLRWVIGPPLKHSLAQLAGTVNEDVLNRLLAGYRQRFGSLGLYENRVLPGIREVLQSLVERGCRLFVATSKPTVYAEQILRHFQLDTFFSAIVGSELDESRSDKAEVIRHLLSTTGIAAGDCIMVGDRKHDVLGALTHGIQTIGVLYGYGSEEELRQAGAAYLANSVAELQQLLLQVVSR